MFIFYTRPLISQTADQRSVKSLSFICLVSRRTGKIHSDLSPTPSLIFHGSKSAKYGFDFRTPLAFEKLWFQNGGTYRNLKRDLILTRKFRRFLPFTGVVKLWVKRCKIWPLRVPGSKGSDISETKNRPVESFGRSYVSTKFGTVR